MPLLVRAGLDTLHFGFAIFDRDLKLVASNKAFRTLRGYPTALCQPGTEIVEFYRYNARRGDYGAGDVEAHAMSRVDRVRGREPHELEHVAPSGQILHVQYTPIVHGGLVLTYSDITARKAAEREAARKEAQLQVALDNMPGALAYTDDDARTSSSATSASPRCTRLRRNCWRRGGRILRFCATSPSTATTATATSTRWSRSAWRACAIRPGEAFEDRAPDGRVYQVSRRRADGRRHRDRRSSTSPTSSARKSGWRARTPNSQVALDNMPGALAYTDDDLNIVVRNDRFADLYPAPKELLEPGRPYPAFLRYLAEHGYYGDGDVDALVGARVESLRNPAGRTFEDRAPDGRVYRVGRRRAATGGTVTVITDVTELKDAEDKLRAAVARAEEANRLVTEKNRTLESLSSKLSKYLSPQIYKSIFSGEKGVEVASQRKKLTIFFSDIAGFTETTDLLESEELTNLLNQYLREMSSIALEHGATIDKFIGDAIMLFFGDPETRGPREDATACVRMAIAMQQRMRDLQAEWRERGQEHVFQLRIGINTGFCTVGNFGSNERVDYTIIGNEVNLAARLQSHADLGGILLAHETYALVKDTVLTEETGTITVKGFPKPVKTYRVVALHDDAARPGA